MSCFVRMRGSICLALFILPAFGLFLPASANDATVSWGVISGSGSGANAAESAIAHERNAIYSTRAELGRAAQLPFTSLTAIGIYNAVDVSGDNNTVNADQTGSNNGDVSSNTNVKLFD